MKHAFLVLIAGSLLGAVSPLIAQKGAPPPPVQDDPRQKQTIYGSDTLYTVTDDDDEGPMLPGIAGGKVFRDELHLPFLYHGGGDLDGGAGSGVRYSHHFSGRAHDGIHRSLFSEAVGQPSSSIDLSVLYEPNTSLELQNHGYTVSLGAVSLIAGGIAIGGNARYNRSSFDERDLEVADYELGPRFAFWPTDRVHIDLQLLYRHIDGYSDRELGLNLSDEEYVTLRHHLAYVASENRDFTYAHDVEARVGIHQNYHVNNFTMLNYFLFSTSPTFSLGPMAGFSLDYRLGSRTSVLTIPVAGRAEYFFNGGSGLVYAQIGYDVPTMPRQRNAQVQVQGSVAYRF